MRSDYCGPRHRVHPAARVHLFPDSVEPAGELGAVPIAGENRVDRRVEASVDHDHVRVPRGGRVEVDGRVVDRGDDVRGRVLLPQPRGAPTRDRL
jgi:hypothetical protein